MHSDTCLNGHVFSVENAVLDFCDDIGLLSHYFKHIQEKSRCLSTVALQTGLEINNQKTKSMRVNTATLLNIDLNSYTRIFVLFLYELQIGKEHQIQNVCVL